MRPGRPRFSVQEIVPAAVGGDSPLRFCGLAGFDPLDQSTAAEPPPSSDQARRDCALFGQLAELAGLHLQQIGGLLGGQDVAFDVGR